MLLDYKFMLLQSAEQCRVISWSSSSEMMIYLLSEHLKSCDTLAPIHTLL